MDAIPVLHSIKMVYYNATSLAAKIQDYKAIRQSMRFATSPRGVGWPARGEIECLVWTFLRGPPVAWKEASAI